MEYLKVFETIDEQQSYLNGDIITPSINMTRGNESTINYVPKVPKKVNHGTITGTALKTKITWEYPLASNFIIHWSSNMSGGHQAAWKGNSTTPIALTAGETLISIDSIDPQEDDKYIYEIII